VEVSLWLAAEEDRRDGEESRQGRGERRIVFYV